MMQLDPSQTGLEVGNTSDDELDLGLAESRLVEVGVKKYARTAARHPLPTWTEGPSVPKRILAREWSDGMSGDYANSANLSPTSEASPSPGSSGDRRSVVEGDSPNIEWYTTEKPQFPESVIGCDFGHRRARCVFAP